VLQFSKGRKEMYLYLDTILDIVGNSDEYIKTLKAELGGIIDLSAHGKVGITL
jgi:hypothetical protein